MLAILAPLALFSLGASAAQDPVYDSYNAYTYDAQTTFDNGQAQRVNVSLFVMSRCPDARLCENVFEEVLKHDHILDKVSLNVDYLGTIDKSLPYGVDCMHGDLECAGNAHQLCVRAHAPLDKFYATLSCMNYGKFPGAIGTVGLTRRCADTAGIDWWRSGVGRCIQGREAERTGRAEERLAWLTGAAIPTPEVPDVEDIDEWADAQDLDYLAKEARKRLVESVKYTKEQGVSKSCTIRIASTLKHAPRECIVDRGVWKGCDDGHNAVDFVRVIREEWDNLQN